MSFDVERLRLLARKLEPLPKVAKLAIEGEPGGWRLAYGLLEIEESALSVVHLISRIEACAGDQIEDLLFDARQELAHIAYHSRDSGLSTRDDPT